MNEDEVRSQVLDAAHAWAAAFNRGDAAACAGCYTEDAAMHAEPLTQVAGRTAIKSFWQGLIDAGFGEVRYLDPQVEVNGPDRAVLSSPWAMNKARGMIHREEWHRSPDGRWLLARDHFEVLEQFS